MDELNEAKNWWHNTLSLNEQKAFKNKHLLSFEISNFGAYKADRTNQMIIQMWKAEHKKD